MKINGGHNDDFGGSLKLPSSPVDVQRFVEEQTAGAEQSQALSLALGIWTSYAAGMYRQWAETYRRLAVLENAVKQENPN